MISTQGATVTKLQSVRGGVRAAHEDLGHESLVLYSSSMVMQYTSRWPMNRNAANNRSRVFWTGSTLRVTEDYEAMSRVAARHVTAVLRANPTALLCLATGASPARMYELLAESGRRKPTLFQQERFLKLDELGGLAPDDPATCEAYLQERLCRPLGIRGDRLAGWHSRPRQPRTECARMATWLAAHGPIDLSILGLGVNGHLGFNEPAAALQAGPHVARLSRASRRHEMLRNARSQARYGLTLGMGDLLRSREILLLVSGPHKAEQLSRLFTGQVTPRFPASFLGLHSALTICCDQAAAALLPRELLR